MGREKGSFQIVAPLTSMMVFCVVILLSSVQTAKAQQGLSLIPPYYGTRNINSYFDHRYPTYNRYPNTTYPNVVIYTGEDNPSGNPYWYDGHDGYDFDLVYERVLAAASGQVVFAGWANPSDRTESYGLHIRVNHGNGYQTRYGHLSAAAVSGGQQVLSGQVIATSGNTGDSSGPHLHFDLYHNAQPTDPFGWSGGYTDPWQSWSGETSYCLWADGQWADICGGVARPLPAPADGTTITVDDQGASFSKGCAAGSPCPYWYEDAAGYNNHMWWTHDNDTVEDYWARWNPSIPQQGIYEVYVYVPNVNATTWQAPYTISHYDGQNTAIVDQYGLSNQWVSIGVYRFHEGTTDSVRITDATGELGVQRRVGVDAVRFVRRAPTYLPDVKNNYSGWNSTLVVRSNGGNAFVDVKFYNPSGGLLTTQPNTNLAGHGVWEVPLPGLSNFSGSVVVDASQDVAVVVEHNNGERYNNYNGIGGAGQTGAAIYVPLAKYNYDGKSSRLYILNTGEAATTVTIASYNEGGSPAGTPITCPNLAPTARCDRQPPAPAAGRYAVRISADQPLAVVVAEEQHSDPNVIYKAQNAFAGGATVGFAPQVKRQWQGEYSTLAVQNLGGWSFTVTVTYYPDDGDPCSHSAWINLQGYHVFQPQDALSCPVSFVGAARVSALGPVAVLVNERGEKGNSGFLIGSQSVVLPRVRRDGGWWTGIRVMNTDGDAPTTGAIYFYHPDGSAAGSSAFTINSAYQSVNLGSAVPVNLAGSARISADRPVAVSVIQALNGSSLQTMMYNGVNR